MPHLDVYETCRRWVQRNTGVPGRADVLELFMWFAHEYLAVMSHRAPREDGRSHKFSIYEIAERVRWAIDIELAPDDYGFKVSNDYKPILARILCRRIPGLQDHLIMRPLIGGEPTLEQLALIDPDLAPPPDHDPADLAALIAWSESQSTNGHVPRTPIPRREPIH